MKKESPVIALLTQVWRNAETSTPKSWERLNCSMRAALKLAIQSGFPFDAADFSNLGPFSPGYWMGAEEEWVYSLAIAEGNYSCATAWEKHKDREPIIADKVMMGDDRHGTFAHMVGDREKERLFVGAWIEWKGDTVKITSFREDGAAVGCSYHAPKYKYATGKIKKRYAISRDDVIRERAEQKERKEIVAKLLAEKGPDVASAFKEILSCRNDDEFKAMPIEKIRKSAKKVGII